MGVSVKNLGVPNFLSKTLRGHEHLVWGRAAAEGDDQEQIIITCLEEGAMRKPSLCAVTF